MAEILQDFHGSKVVIIPDIIFKNKQNIDWSNVEKYLEKCIGQIVNIVESKDVIYIGKQFPNEYANSNYTSRLKGVLAKVKANAAQKIVTMLEIATEKEQRENYKEKHDSDAANGWYYYTTRFAVPIYENDVKTEQYNIYRARLVVNHAANGKLYLYDMVDIKKEASTLYKTNDLVEQ